MLPNLSLRRVFTGIALLTMLVFLSSVVYADPPVNVKKGKFVKASDKGAMKAYRQKGKGFKGSDHAKKLGNDLFKKAKKNKNVDLKEDTAGNLVYIDDKDGGVFRINKTTGDVSFSKGYDGLGKPGATKGLPGKDDAVRMAKKYLSDLGEMPGKQDEMVLRHVGGLRMVDIDESGNATEYDKLVTVEFGRQLDGVDVGGPGSKIIVELGADGELVSLTKRWSEVQAETKKGADFFTENEIKGNMKKYLGAEWSKASKVDAGAPDFGYFDDGQGNIEPAYFYEADLTYDGPEAKAGKDKRKGHNDKYFGVTPALKGHKADFTQLKKAKKNPEKMKKKPAKDSKDKPSKKDDADDASGGR